MFCNNTTDGDQVELNIQRRAHARRCRTKGFSRDMLVLNRLLHSEPDGRYQGHVPALPFIRKHLTSTTVRMQAHYPQSRPYRNTAHAFVSIFQEGAHSPAAKGVPLLGGIRTLWRGAEATTFRGVVLSISQIASYDQVKQMLKQRGAMKEGIGLHITASLFAGCVCCLRLPQ